MAVNEVNYTLNQENLSRTEARKEVVKKFLQEEPGPAEDEVYNRYTYKVEKTPEGEIWLTRPANLKLGFDFRVDVKGMEFKRGTESPSHEDLFEDLKLKHDKNPEYAEEVRQSIIQVFKMEEPENVLEEIEDRNIGFSIELLLKMCKWLAIEQDIRYWNGYGRTKNVIWLDIMEYFDYRYEIRKMSNGRKFYFFDEEGKEYTENAATKLLEEEGALTEM